MSNAQPAIIQPPTPKEQRSLRFMIWMGVLSLAFFLYNISQPENIGYWPLYILLMVTMVYYGLRFLHEWYHYYRISVPVRPVLTTPFTVDVLTTYCAGEPFDMLAETLQAIVAIRYPHSSWCCDEANDPRVKQLCMQLGVRHVTRSRKNDAKAGNINHALQFATGDICVILDPDHVPAPCFLDELIPYFEDQSVGFVQVVQAYHNRGESLVAKGAAQQTYQFYGPMMMTMNSYGTVQAIGANCVFRRSALDSIGGHASGLAEDMHTAMRLHAKGWRSVYVPVIVTRGLVPATMSSYYKQQLKWSRGTWELLVTAYPRLFRYFTWRQRLHYFTLPFHYLGGLIFLINFLIPVISLFTGHIPLQMDIVRFVLASFPFFCMGIFIRHYVQQWVAEEQDRGFHVVGGILYIGTWWVHSLGFVYTLLRKKVPYIPTPKDDRTALPVSLSIPNMLIGLISLAAVVYGLTAAYTPYSIFMAVLAFLQVVFMGFILSVSGYVDERSKISKLAVRVRKWDRWVILSHGFLRRYSVWLSAFTVLVFILGSWKLRQMPDYLPGPLKGHDVFYPGIYLGTANLPGSAVNDRRYERSAFAVVPFGGNGSAADFVDTSVLATLWSNQMVPLLMWDFRCTDLSGQTAFDTALYRHVLEGRYDFRFRSVARQLAAFSRPVLLCFDVKAGGLFADTSASDSAGYIKAWRYLHTLMESEASNRIAWIWRPHTMEQAQNCFPGFAFTDWLAADLIRSDAVQAPDSLYLPFHQLALYRYSGLPVMITAMSAPTYLGMEWWQQFAATLGDKFTEVKSVLLLPGDAGKLLPAGTDNIHMFNFSHTAAGPIGLQSAGKQIPLPASLRSVDYNKGYYWFRNTHSLNERILLADLRQMKSIGINTVERTMGGVYDDSFLKVAHATGLRVIPRFRLPATPEDVMSASVMASLREELLELVKRYRDNPDIVAWNLGDDVLAMLEGREYAPAEFFYRDGYTGWLRETCRLIRSLDSTRPLLMDLHWGQRGRATYAFYQQQVPAINWYLLEPDGNYLQGLTDSLDAQMVWGKVQPEYWRQMPTAMKPTTIPEWQDIENNRFVRLEGILDVKGRRKPGYAIAADCWAGTASSDSKLPEVKILKPLVVMRPGFAFQYQLIYKKTEDRWAFLNESGKRYDVEWWLVKTDQAGSTLFMKEAGNGPSISLKIPEDPEHYLLYAEIIMNGSVRMIKTGLSTPLD